MIQAPPFYSPRRGEVFLDVTELCGETGSSPPWGEMPTKEAEGVLEVCRKDSGGDADKGGRGISG